MNWFFRQGYAQGVFFTLSFLAIGPFLDGVTKLLGGDLPAVEILFFRFAFSAITILPMLLYKNGGNFSKDMPKRDKKLNLLRGGLGFLSFLGCIYSVKLFPLSEVTVIFWTLPFFILILSIILLKENVTLSRIVATIIGFCGLVFFFSPNFSSVNLSIFIPLITTLLFALQDILIKLLTLKNSTLRCVFDYAVIVSLCSLPILLFVWVTPSGVQLCLLGVLGIGANLMQLCIFKAFQSVEISALAPFRYTEIIFASIFGFLFFGEIPTRDTFLAAIVIIPTTLYLAYSEKRAR